MIDKSQGVRNKYWLGIGFILLFENMIILIFSLIGFESIEFAFISIIYISIMFLCVGIYASNRYFKEMKGGTNERN